MDGWDGDPGDAGDEDDGDGPCCPFTAWAVTPHSCPEASRSLTPPAVSRMQEPRAGAFALSLGVTEPFLCSAAFPCCPGSAALPLHPGRVVPRCSGLGAITHPSPVSPSKADASPAARHTAHGGSPPPPCAAHTRPLLPARSAPFPPPRQHRSQLSWGRGRSCPAGWGPAWAGLSQQNKSPQFLSPVASGPGHGDGQPGRGRGTALSHPCVSPAPDAASEVSVPRPMVTPGKGDVQVHHAVAGPLVPPWSPRHR